MEPLNLPKPKPEPTKGRERIQGAVAEAKLLAAVGERIAPDCLKYLGSFAVHVYQHPLNPMEFVTLTQTANFGAVSDEVAQHALKELVRATMIRYGHKPPKKRFQSQEI
jgi:hypothetical protein